MTTPNGADVTKRFLTEAAPKIAELRRRGDDLIREGVRLRRQAEDMEWRSLIVADLARVTTPDDRLDVPPPVDLNVESTP